MTSLSNYTEGELKIMAAAYLTAKSFIDLDLSAVAKLVGSASAHSCRERLRLIKKKFDATRGSAEALGGSTATGVVAGTPKKRNVVNEGVEGKKTPSRGRPPKKARTPKKRSWEEESEEGEEDEDLPGGEEGGDVESGAEDEDRDEA